MAEQYFTADPTCESKQVPCSFVYRGHGLNFMTDAGVFSKGELDTGTRLLLDALPDVYGDVLDLGCGWGAIGVAVKKKYPRRACHDGGCQSPCAGTVPLQRGAQRHHGGMP